MSVFYATRQHLINKLVSQDFRITWTLAPYSSHGGLPPVVEFPWRNPSNMSQSDSVYFSETTKSQLQPDGNGFGTFDTEVLTPSLDTRNSSASDMKMLQAGLSPGNIIRYASYWHYLSTEDLMHNPGSHSGE